MSDDLEKIYREIKIKMKDNKVVFGTDQTLKLLKNGKIEKVVIASNCPEDTKLKINYYTKLNDEIEVYESNLDREELGKTLGVPFLVAVVSIKK